MQSPVVTESLNKSVNDYAKNGTRRIARSLVGEREQQDVVLQVTCSDENAVYCEVSVNAGVTTGWPSP
jgi:hypothetical protein